MTIPTWVQILMCVAVAFIAVAMLINSGTKKAYAKKKEEERKAKKAAAKKSKKKK